MKNIKSKKHFCKNNNCKSNLYLQITDTNVYYLCNACSKVYDLEEFSEEGLRDLILEAEEMSSWQEFRGYADCQGWWKKGDINVYNEGWWRDESIEVKLFRDASATLGSFTYLWEIIDTEIPMTNYDPKKYSIEEYIIEMLPEYSPDLHVYSYVVKSPATGEYILADYKNIIEDILVDNNIEQKYHENDIITIDIIEEYLNAYGIETSSLEEIGPLFCNEFGLEYIETYTEYSKSLLDRLQELKDVWNSYYVIRLSQESYVIMKKVEKTYDIEKDNTIKELKNAKVKVKYSELLQELNIHIDNETFKFELDEDDYEGDYWNTISLNEKEYDINFQEGVSLAIYPVNKNGYTVFSKRKVLGVSQ